MRQDDSGNTMFDVAPRPPVAAVDLNTVLSDLRVVHGDTCPFCDPLEEDDPPCADCQRLIERLRAALAAPRQSDVAEKVVATLKWWREVTERNGTSGDQVSDILADFEKCLAAPREDQ